MPELVIVKHPDTAGQVMRLERTDYDPAVHGGELTEDEAQAILAGESPADEKPKSRRSRADAGTE